MPLLGRQMSSKSVVWLQIQIWADAAILSCYLYNTGWVKRLQGFLGTSGGEVGTLSFHVAGLFIP